MLKKIFAVVIVLFVVAIAATLSLVGPWPAYGPGGYKTAGYYTDAIDALAASAERSELTDAPNTFEVGWATVDMTPDMPTPLGGFGARRGAMAEGTHDPVNVKAVAIADGADTVVIVGSDLFTITPNLADLIREKVQAERDLPADRILLNGSHTHSGAAGFIPGFMATLFGGAFVEGLPEFLAEKYAEAIIGALDSLEPARMARGSIQAPQFIRNRTREADVDAALDYLVFVQDNGKMCFVTRYSAHATVLGSSNMLYSGDYAGYVQRGIEQRTGNTAIFLSGAVCSMGPSAPAGDTDFARAEAMGDALAELVVNAVKESIELKGPLDVAASGARLLAPPLQIRMFHPKLRFSPFLVEQLGLSRDSWLQTVRIGDVVLVGTPCDFSGEISLDLREWAEAQDYAMWCLSFNGAYNGYISPDRYYDEYFDEDGEVAYETGMMSWAGPDQEAFFTSLIKASFTAITTGQ